MSDRITVTSTELHETSSDMKATAQSIQEELNRMLTRVQTLTSSWTGQAAGAFDAYYQQMSAGWSQLRDGMEGVATMLDTAARSYEETETGIAGQFRA